MTAPTVIGVSSQKTSTGETDLVWTRSTDGLSDATIQVDDLLFMHVTRSFDTETTGGECATPSGWTEVRPKTPSTSSFGKTFLFVRRVTASEPSTYTADLSGSTGSDSGNAGIITIVRGANLTESLESQAVEIITTVNAEPGPEVSTTEADSLLLHFLAGYGATTQTVTGMPNELYDFGNDPGRATALCGGWEEKATAGGPYNVALTRANATECVQDAVVIAPPPIESSGLTSGTDATDQSSYTTASITPTARALILASVLSTKASNTDIPSITGCNLTWVRVRTEDFGSSASYRLTLFRAMSPVGNPPTTGTLTISFGGVAQTGCSWAVNEFTGVDTGGTNGSRAIRNDRGDTSTGTGTTLTVTLPQIQSPNNVVFGAFGFIDNAAVTPGSGFTEIAEVQDTSPDRTLQTEFQQGRDRTVDAVGPSVAADGIAGIAIEIRATGVITQSSLDSGSDATLKTSYTTNSITPSADSLILLAVYNSRSGTATLPTVTGCSMTWVRVSSSTFNVGDTQRLTIFRAMSTTPDPGVLTIDFDGVGQQACDWSLVEYHNIDTSGSNGENAIGVRGTSGGGQNTGTSLAVSLADFASSSNATYGAFGVDAADTISPGSGLTTIHSITDTSATQALLTETKLSEDNLVDASWPTSTFAAAFAAEIVQQPESAFSDSTPAASPAPNEATGTPTFRVYQVTEDEDADFRVKEVSSSKASTVDVQVVTEREDADFTVKVVTDQSLAEKFALVVEGEFTTTAVAVVGYRDDYVDQYALP